MKTCSPIIISLAALIILSGCGAESSMRKGDKCYALGEYFDAAAYYKKAYSATSAKDRPKRGERALKLADCYMRINYSQRAAAAYSNAVRYNVVDSTTHLRLAQQLMKAGNYKQAAIHFQASIDTLTALSQAIEGDQTRMRDKEELGRLLELSQTGLKSASMAPIWKESGSKYTIKKENLFNSRRADYSPMLAGENGDQLFFSSTRNTTKGDEISGITGMKTGDIFFSSKDENGKWEKPEEIDTELNSEYDEGACCFTPDFKTMYLTQCSSDPSYPRYANIGTSQRSDASWGKTEILQITRDTLSSYAHPAISPDGEWLYFVSDMPGGEGGLDIWRTRITTSGLGGVENVGRPINTPGDEMFPTFRPNGDLYFSSNGHPGMGGLDIYIAMPDTASANPWADSSEESGSSWLIEHPGYPLNSMGDDFGMTFEGMLNQGFFSSNRGDGKGWDHIYSFVNPEVVQTVRGYVYERDGYELTNALVYMVGNDGTNLRLSVRGDGSFTQIINPNVDYVFLGTCKGYLNHKEELRVEPVEESQEYVLQFPLASITAPVLIDNIFYDFDKATLRPESTQSLDELVILLNENPNVTIELSAHCDYKGSSEYNINLSQRRAESVVNYLIDKGIAADRLSPVGYGKEKPKRVRKKLASQYDFLEEDMTLSEDFILSLKPEEQEICNQLNRRTEFIVLRTTYGLFDELGKLKTDKSNDFENSYDSNEEEEPDEAEIPFEADAAEDDATLFDYDETEEETSPPSYYDPFGTDEPAGGQELPTGDFDELFF